MGITREMEVENCNLRTKVKVLEAQNEALKDKVNDRTHELAREIERHQPGYERRIMLTTDYKMRNAVKPSLFYRLGAPGLFFATSAAFILLARVASEPFPLLAGFFALLYGTLVVMSVITMF